MSEEKNCCNENCTQEEVNEENAVPKKETRAKTSKKSSKEAELNSKIEALEAEIASQKDSYLRLCAEYDNFRKRSSKEKLDTFANATSKAVLELLPVIDNFERAVTAQGENVDQGFAMIYAQFKEYLEKLGVKEMEAENSTFDPNMHIAVMHIEDSQYEDSQVIEVFQKGYTLGDKVIRPACVKVAN